jgi:hypothetical protein
MCSIFVLNALVDGGKIESMCCSTGEVLCDFQRVIISGIVRLTLVTDYCLYRHVAYVETLVEIRVAASRPRIMVTHIFIL